MGGVGTTEPSPGAAGGIGSGIGSESAGAGGSDAGKFDVELRDTGCPAAEPAGLVLDPQPVNPESWPAGVTVGKAEAPGTGDPDPCTPGTTGAFSPPKLFGDGFPVGDVAVPGWKPPDG